MIFSHVGGSRHPLDPVLKIFGIAVILRVRPVRKPIRFFSVKMELVIHFLQSCDFYVFVDYFCLLDFCGFECPETPL